MAKILIVDDDNQIITFIKFILEKNSYSVVTANSGLQGLEVIHKEKPDLVLLDVMMPGLDGYEVCRRIKTNPETEHTPVIMLTALGMGEDFEKAVENGANWYIVKPFKPQHLLQRIEFLLKIPPAEPP